MSSRPSAACRGIAASFRSPMRGNELAELARVNAKPEEFPIPMRGNEYQRPPDAALNADGFRSP